MTLVMIYSSLQKHPVSRYNCFVTIKLMSPVCSWGRISELKVLNLAPTISEEHQGFLLLHYTLIDPPDAPSPFLVLSP